MVIPFGVLLVLLGMFDLLSTLNALGRRGLLFSMLVGAALLTPSVLSGWLLSTDHLNPDRLFPGLKVAVAVLFVVGVVIGLVFLVFGFANILRALGRRGSLCSILIGTALVIPVAVVMVTSKASAPVDGMGVLALFAAFLGLFFVIFGFRVLVAQKRTPHSQ
jgi:hypothetical protein